MPNLPINTTDSGRFAAAGRCTGMPGLSFPAAALKGVAGAGQSAGGSDPGGGLSA